MNTTSTIEKSSGLHSATAPSIYVVSLSDYNAGIGHGVWIDCTEGWEAVTIQVDDMLATSPTAAKTGQSAEEWAIHGYENFAGLTLSESEDLEELCTLAEAIEEHGEPYAVYVEYRDNKDVSAFEDAYQGTYSSDEDWAESFLEETGQLDSLPANLRYYFDYAAYARDCDLSGDIFTAEVSDGTAVFWNR